MTILLTPKVIFCIPGENMVFRNTDIEPKLLRLQIGAEALLRVALEVRDVQPVLWKFVYDREELPRPADRLFLHDG